MPQRTFAEQMIHDLSRDLTDAKQEISRLRLELAKRNLAIATLERDRVAPMENAS